MPQNPKNLTTPRSYTRTGTRFGPPVPTPSQFEKRPVDLLKKWIVGPPPDVMPPLPPREYAVPSETLGPWAAERSVPRSYARPTPETIEGPSSPFAAERGYQATNTIFNTPEDDMMNARADAIINRPTYSLEGSPVASQPATNAAVAGLRGFNAPRVQEGAPSPEVAANILRGPARPEATPATAFETPEGWQRLPTVQSDPTELAEMFRLANRPAEQVAFGAPEYWKNRLGERLGEEVYGTEQARGREETFQAAKQAGFASPQEAAEAVRQMEAYKIAGPERVGRIAGEYGIAQEEARGRSNLAVQESKASQDANFWERVANLQNAGITDVSQISAGGRSISTRPEQRVPPQLQESVTTARAALARAREMVGGGPETAQAEGMLRQAIGAVLAYHPAEQKFKQFVVDTLLDPMSENQSVQQIIVEENAALIEAGQEPFTPDEIRIIQDLLLRVKGI